jgi:rod shape-determining protein MreC
VNDNVQLRTIRAAAVAGVGFLQDMFAFIPNYFELRHENRVLRELNLTLSDEVNRLRESRLENIRLHELLGLKEHSKSRYIGANIVGKNLQLLRNTITLDAGEADGVRTSMPVVTESGLVGKIAATSSRYSVAQVLLNRDIRVSAKVQRSRVDGIIEWSGGKRLTLENVAKTLDVQPGDVVVTSEYSSLYPPGIRIGVVSSTRQVPGALFQAIDVVATVDFPRLEEVFVVSYVPDSSRLSLERRIQP